MFLSQKCHYALRAVFELSLRNEQGPVKIHDIAEAQGIPSRFLEVILNQLKHGGFVISYRGQDGGYELARPANQITIEQIVAFMQELPKSFRLPTEHPASSSRGDYALGQLWEQVYNAIHDIMVNTTIAELVDQETTHSSRNMNYTI